MKIELRYDLQFVEIGIDGNHVHFLIQSVAMNSPKKIISTVKSITAEEIFRLHPEVKRFLWGGRFWTSDYYVNTVGQYENEEVIKKYLQNQGKSDILDGFRFSEFLTNLFFSLPRQNFQA